MIDDDAIEPRAEAALLLEGRELGDDLDEDFLCCSSASRLPPRARATTPASSASNRAESASGFVSGLLTVVDTSGHAL
jgi:hypothetical protein